MGSIDKHRTCTLVYRLAARWSLEAHVDCMAHDIRLHLPRVISPHGCLPALQGGAPGDMSLRREQHV